MKLSAVAPHEVVPVPESEDSGFRRASDVISAVKEPQPVSAGSGQDLLNSTTREGLLRLAEKIAGKRQKDSKEKKRAKALKAYALVNEDEEDFKGVQLNKSA